MSGLFVILGSQFAHQIFSAYQITEMFSNDDNRFLSTDSSVFSIKFPTNWDSNDIKSFNWQDLKNDTTPFDNFPF